MANDGAILQDVGRNEQLQIRVTAAEKSALKKLAKSAGQAVSAYVLSRALPNARWRYLELLEELRCDDDPSYALAELNDLLESLSRGELMEALSEPPSRELSPYLRNYVTAMVELAAHRKGASPPTWVRDIEPLSEPRFAVPLASLRLHLLRASPVPFRRRNLFVDAAVGDRV